MNKNVLSENAQAQKLIERLDLYFLQYYRRILYNETIDANKVLEDIQVIISDVGIRDSEAVINFSELTYKLNNFLKGDNLAVNIFLTPDGLINCWLGRLVFSDSGSKDIWGKTSQYKLIIIDNFLIHDYLYYASDGQEQLEAVTIGGLIFCNKEAFRSKALKRQEFLKSRYGLKRRTTYNPSSVDRERRNLQRLSWGELFLESSNEYFIAKAQDDLLDIAIFHELGHIHSDVIFHGASNSEIFTEQIALLTELKYGARPYESLNTLLSFAWESPWTAYRQSAQNLLFLFIRAAEEDKISCGYVKNKRELSKSGGILLCMSESQIRETAGRIYAEIMRGR